MPRTKHALPVLFPLFQDNWLSVKEGAVVVVYLRFSKGFEECSGKLGTQGGDDGNVRLMLS